MARSRVYDAMASTIDVCTSALGARRPRRRNFRLPATLTGRTSSGEFARASDAVPPLDWCPTYLGIPWAPSGAGPRRPEEGDAA
jgi:hypothetical protein